MFLMRCYVCYEMLCLLGYTLLIMIRFVYQDVSDL